MLRTIRWTARLLALAGAVLLAFCAATWLEGAAFQAYALRRLDTPRAAPLARHSAGTPLPHAVVAAIRIPRIGLETIAVEGDDSQALRLGAGHIPGTALPGEPGNVVLAGHRDTVFRGLRNIAAGDRIVLTTPQGAFTYQVQSVQVTTPDDVGVLRPTAESRLTLITCYPFSYLGSAPRRWIVRARLVESADRLNWSQRTAWAVQKEDPGSRSPRDGALSWSSLPALAASWPFWP